MSRSQRLKIFREEPDPSKCQAPCRSGSTSLDSDGRLELFQAGCDRALPAIARFLRAQVCQASAELLASCSDDKTVRLWELTTWTAVKVLERLTTAALSLCPVTLVADIPKPSTPKIALSRSGPGRWFGPAACSATTGAPEGG